MRENPGKSVTAGRLEMKRTRGRQRDKFLDGLVMWQEHTSDLILVIVDQSWPASLIYMAHDDDKRLCFMSIFCLSSCLFTCYFHNSRMVCWHVYSPFPMYCVQYAFAVHWVLFLNILQCSMNVNQSAVGPRSMCVKKAVFQLGEPQN